MAVAKGIIMLIKMNELEMSFNDSESGEYQALADALNSLQSGPPSSAYKLYKVNIKGLLYQVEYQRMKNNDNEWLITVQSLKKSADSLPVEFEDSGKGKGKGKGKALGHEKWS